MAASNSDEEITSTFAQFANDPFFNSLPDLVIADGIDFPRIATEADEKNNDIVLTESDVDIREPTPRSTTPPTRNRTPEPDPARDEVVVEVNRTSETDTSESDNESESAATSSGAAGTRRRRIPWAQFLANLSAVSQYSRANVYATLTEQQLEQERRNKIIEMRINMYHKFLDLRCPQPSVPVKPPVGRMHELLLARLRMVPLIPDQYPSIESVLHADRGGACLATTRHQAVDEVENEN